MKLALAIVSAVSAAALLGCGPAPAPKDTDGLARFFFDNFDPKSDAATSDAELQDAVKKLDATIHGSAVTDPVKGVLAKITKTELDDVGLAKNDPAIPQGMFITDVVHCSLDQLEKIALNPDQLSLYPEAYESYKRTEDPGKPDFNPTWVTTYKSSKNALISNQFTATENSGMRKVPDVADSEGKPAAFGKFVVGRVFMPKPAVFDAPDPGVVDYNQDYQVEIFYPRKNNELVHFYAMWRFMHLGVLGDSTSSLFIDQTEGGMLDWDTKTDALCAKP